MNDLVFVSKMTVAHVKHQNNQHINKNSQRLIVNMVIQCKNGCILHRGNFCKEHSPSFGKSCIKITIAQLLA